MKKVLRFIIPHLQRGLIFIEQKIAVKKVLTDININSLAPKIITDPKELQKIEPYLISLKNALDTASVNNIAITGSYGSGKSTILKTFQSLYPFPEYEYLNISLASFEDNKKDKSDFERKLEVSILQQMFYHVKPGKIPDSRFKRIINLTWEKLLLQTCFFIIWLSCVIILFKFDYIEKLNPKGWAYKFPVDWGAFLLIVTFLFGVGLYVKSIIRLFSNSKISKFSIKGEIELNESNDKSVFNQHLEEILYFFERTEFNVVIIEDVDRFASTDIFTKLREINILVNNSDLIERKISFVYAIKDEIFKISTERVKFFELIIPVIPFINPSNASDQLTKMITGAGLEKILPTDFTDDVVTFIDDIDMRLLINIFHEYQIYSTLLSQDLSQSNLFSMIVYKNMYPEDFGELPKRRGKLYQFISGRTNYANSLKSSLREILIETEDLLKAIETEAQVEIQELRSIYINSIISKLADYKSFYTTAQIGNIEATEEVHFNHIRSATDIQYYKFNHHYGSQYTLVGPQSSKITLKSVEREISKIPYDQREKNLVGKTNGEIDRLKKRIEDIKKEMAEIDSYGIKEIFEKTPIDQYIEDFKESDLIRYLLLNGYINENYNDYISVFHAINLTQDDFAFEAKVKNGISLPYEYPLQNTATIFGRLQTKYFKREAIWNYAFLDEVLKSTMQDALKREYFFGTLKRGNENAFEFISGYVDKKTAQLGIFINHLIKHKPNIWFYLYKNSNFSTEKTSEYIRLIFDYADYEDICQLEDINALSTHLAEMEGFVDFASSFTRIKTLHKFIKDNLIKVRTLDHAVNPPNNFFEFIIKNNSYLITPENIRSVYSYAKIDFDEQQFYNSNYTLLQNSAPKELFDYLNENINLYIQSVFLELGVNHNESEDALIQLLNNPDLTPELKRLLIDNQTNEIESLSQIINTGDKEIVLEYQVIKVTWDNVYDYYISTQEEDLNDKIVNFINSRSTYILLSENKISNLGGADQDAIRDFCKILIYTDKLNIDANTSVLKSIPYAYDILDYSKLSDDKVKWMISNKFVTLTVDNFDGMKQHFGDLHIKLLEINEKGFISRFGEFALERVDVELLLKSSAFSISGKLEVVQSIDDDIIIDNPNIADLVCYLLPDNKSTSLRYEVFEAMFAANNSVEKKVKVLIVNIGKFDDSQLQRFIEKIGEDYSRIFMKQNKPVFGNKEFNRELFKILQMRSMISSFSINEEKGEIKVVANY